MTDSKEPDDFDRVCAKYWYNDARRCCSWSIAPANEARAVRRGLLAALREMREPGEQMLNAGRAKREQALGSGADSIFQAMLDEMIRQGEAATGQLTDRAKSR